MAARRTVAIPRSAVSSSASAIDVRAAAQQLIESIGIEPVAALLHRSADEVESIAAGPASSFSEADADRIRGTFILVNVLTAIEDPHTVRAWMLGSNPQLQDHSPIQLLAEGDVRPVTNAVRLFAQSA